MGKRHNGIGELQVLGDLLDHLMHRIDSHVQVLSQDFYRN
jgi:hypothetical protein